MEFDGTEMVSHSGSTDMSILLSPLQDVQE